MSTVRKATAAGAAVDGNLNVGIHSYRDRDPWLAVDLADVYTIVALRVYNRHLGKY